LDTGLLTLLALALALLHFGVPLAYYSYLRVRWLSKPWGIAPDTNYRPKVTVIVPTYNEAELIESKLDDLARQDYPSELLEVVVVDSASTDGTVERVEGWARRNPDVKLVLLKEPMRRGMIHALNYALKYVSENAEIIVFTDADSFWDENTLGIVTKYFADPNVGALTTSIEPLEKREAGRESTYRDFYNIVRVSESKIHSTPIHNGALIAFRKTLLERIGGLPTYTGNDDSTPASLIAFMGYRAIQVDDVVVREPILKNRVSRKVRRAQHLILHFLHTKRYAKKSGIYRKNIFDKIWLIESYLHLVNPWLLIASAALLLTGALVLHVSSITLLLAGIALLPLKGYRTWVETQLCLVIACIKNLYSKEIAWEK